MKFIFRSSKYVFKLSNSFTNVLSNLSFLESEKKIFYIDNYSSKSEKCLSDAKIDPTIAVNNYGYSKNIASPQIHSRL